MELPSHNSVDNLNNPEPLFNAGAFDIVYFSDSPEGFEFQTRQSVGRTEGMGSGPDLGLTEEERSKLAQGMKGEVKFRGVSDVVDARRQLRDAVKADAPQDEVEGLQARFDNVRRDYISSGKKIGLRAMRLAEDGNTLTADVKFVDFPAYNLFASPESSSEVLEMSSAEPVRQWY